MNEESETRRADAAEQRHTEPSDKQLFCKPAGSLNSCGPLALILWRWPFGAFAPLLRSLCFCALARLLEHITPLPFGEGLGGEAVGGEAVVGEAVFYSALSTCSLICSSSSFIFTTMFCISAWLLLEPVVLISRPISWAMKPSFLPLGVSSSSVSRKYFR